MYLYRAVNPAGYIIDFCLSKSRDKQADKRFFKKALIFSYISKPRVITVDKNPTYPVAIQESKEEKHKPEGMQLRQVRYPSNIILWGKITILIRSKYILCWD